MRLSSSTRSSKTDFVGSGLLFLAKRRFGVFLGPWGSWRLPSQRFSIRHHLPRVRLRFLPLSFAKQDKIADALTFRGVSPRVNSGNIKHRVPGVLNLSGRMSVYAYGKGRLGGPQCISQTE